MTKIPFQETAYSRVCVQQSSQVQHWPLKVPTCLGRCRTCSTFTTNRTSRSDHTTNWVVLNMALVVSESTRNGCLQTSIRCVCSRRSFYCLQLVSCIAQNSLVQSKIRSSPVVSHIRLIYDLLRLVQGTQAAPTSWNCRTTWAPSVERPFCPTTRLWFHQLKNYRTCLFVHNFRVELVLHNFDVNFK